MSAPLEQTRHPGIYKRGDRYVVAYRANGRQKRETVPTLKAALRVKRARETDRDRGEYHEESRLRFRDYADEWVARYQGNGRRGFTEDTRADYRRDLERYAFPYLDARLGRTVAGIRRRDLANWIGWLCDPEAQGAEAERTRREREARRRGVAISAVPALPVEPVHLADATIRRVACPVRACLATAADEGLIRANPADGLRLPHRPRVEDAEAEPARSLTRSELDAFLRVVHPEYRTMFRLLAATGIRWGELAALRWRDLRLDGSEPTLRVRRALGRRRKNSPPTFKPPKSRHGIRDVPLDPALVFELRRRRADAERVGDDDLVFAARNGEPLRQENVRRRVLRPAAEEACVAWAGFHTFRHTCASLLLAQGRNVKQVQRWLGHHAASFTLDTYAHLLDEGVGDALDLDGELATKLARDGVGSLADEHRGDPARDRDPALDRVAQAP